MLPFAIGQEYKSNKITAINQLGDNNILKRRLVLNDAKCTSRAGQIWPELDTHGQD